MPGLIGASGDSISISGHDLSTEIIPSWTFVDLFQQLCVGSRPTAAQGRMINAMLVTVAEHGLTPSAATTRLTLLGSPESPQGAVAAGLLGAGSAFLGTPQQSAELFGSIQAQSDPESAARSVVKESVEAGVPLPGFGHPIHRMGDPRTEALTNLQRELEIDDTHMMLAHQISSLLSEHKNKTVPLNAAGAIGAIVCDLGYPAIMGRAIAIVARSAGLVAHVIDETNEPIASHIWTVLRTIDGNDHTSSQVGST